MSKKSKSKSSNEPTAFAKGYITPALGAVQSAYGSVAPKADAISDTIYGQLPGLAESAFGDNPLVEAGQGYLGDVLGGKYLSAGNPYLDQIAATTRSNVADNINATFSKAGRTGSGANVAALGRGLSEAENALRYQAYNAERNAMAQAAGLIPSVNGAQYQGLGAYLTAAGAATGIPLDAARGYAGTIGSLVSPYSTQTNTQKPSDWAAFKDVVGTAAQIAGGFSDRRLKIGIEKLGELADGLGVYTYRYIWGGPEQVGVMADEVRRFRPWALGAKVNGFDTVHYGAL